MHFAENLGNADRRATVSVNKIFKSQNVSSYSTHEKAEFNMMIKKKNPVICTLPVNVREYTLNL